jgi:beta-glucosidase
MVKLREAIQNYWLYFKRPNPGAPTIQKWKEVITTINTEANKTRLKFLFYTELMLFICHINT